MAAQVRILENSLSASKQRSKETAFFLVFALIFGVTVRLFPLLKTDFPLVDGGMFYVMIRDLQASHFALPIFTTYNQANIPFAYAPLAFYLSGIIHGSLRAPLISILKWQPFVTNLLILPVFFLFAKQIVRSGNKAALATLIFALTPNSYWWQIVGGGLTRALGALFFLLTAFCADKMYRERKSVWIIATALSGALSALSHPEWALQAVTAIALFWFFHGRDRQGILISVAVGLGMALLTSPWWISVIQEHGFVVFFQASQATESRWLFWTTPLTMGFTGERVPIIAVLAMCGLFIHIAKRDFLLPAWALLSLAVDPRGGVPASIFPFSILAMTALSDGIASRLVETNDDDPPNQWAGSIRSPIGLFFWGTFMLILLYGAYTVSSTLPRHSLDAEERDATRWAADHTARTDRFLILDEYENPLFSPLREWFPALANRRSVATVQGSEWLAGEAGYSQQMALNRSLRQCLYQDVQCLNALPIQYDFILLSIKSPDGNIRLTPLLLSLEASAGFETAYATPGIRIFKVNE